MFEKFETQAYGNGRGAPAYLSNDAKVEPCPREG